MERVEGAPIGRHDVAIVCDYTLFLEVMCSHIARHDDLRVRLHAHGPRDALAGLARTKVEMALLTLLRRDTDVLALLKELRHRWPSLPILIVSLMDERLYAERMLHAGATGFVMADVSISELDTAIRTVLAGELYVSHRMNSILLQRLAMSDTDESLSPLSQLSDRELHIFQLIGAGLSASTIALRLGISPKTVETYRERLQGKLSVSNREQLTRLAVNWVEHAGAPER